MWLQPHLILSVLHSVLIFANKNFLPVYKFASLNFTINLPLTPITHVKNSLIMTNATSVSPFLLMIPKLTLELKQVFRDKIVVY